MKKLSIIVPYRDRQAHLRKFLPHMSAYFSRDKIDRHIPCRITIVEQNDDQPFNLGTLRNIGFDLTREDYDYFCFHDVDYLPLWADYRYPENPTRIIWYGADVVPYDKGDTVMIRHRYEDFFGGVVLFTREHFQRVNGYSNGYIGWGYEDTDLRHRCLAHGLTVDHRDGTYQPLQHRNRGLNRDLSYNEVGRKNRRRFNQRKSDLRFKEISGGDGLGQLDYRIDERRPLADPAGSPFQAVELVKVSF